MGKWSNDIKGIYDDIVKIKVETQKNENKIEFERKDDKESLDSDDEIP